MKNLKKKNLSPKNLRRMKSEQHIKPPIDSVLKEMKLLKKELKQMKQIRSKYQNRRANDYSHQIQNQQPNIADTLENNRKQVSNKFHGSNEELLPQTKQNITKIQLHEIFCTAKDKKLKMDIEINKLKKLILKGTSDSIGSQFNVIANMVNSNTQTLARDLQAKENDLLQIENSFGEFRRRVEQDNYRQKYKSIIKHNKMLEGQVQELRQRLTLNYELQRGKRQVLANLDDEFSLLKRQNEELAVNNQKLRQLSNKLNSQLQLELQNNKVVNSIIQKKQQQVAILKQQINFARIEYERSRQQKRQIDLLNRQLLKNYQELKVSQKLVEKQLQKEIQSNNKLGKQVFQDKQNIKNLTEKLATRQEEYNQLKKDNTNNLDQLNRQHNKINQLQERNNELKNRNDKYEQVVDMLKTEVLTLQMQNEQIKKANENYKNMHLKAKGKELDSKSRTNNKQSERIKAFEQIQSMIDHHKKISSPKK